MTEDPCTANDIDCRAAVQDLYEYLDGELTAEMRTSISDHLDACAPCLDAFEFHNELKMLVGQKCRTELPTGLRDRVFDALRALDT
jgi:mycothiol system anti-sigma-R factor